MSLPRVAAVSRDEMHHFSKVPHESITLVAGLGVLGDAHAGTLVQHRSRVRRDPNQPNLRQVHLLRSEFLDEVRAAGHDVGAGSMGENVLTTGLDLAALPRDTLVSIGDTVLRVTGLRNPCTQINDLSPGLLRLCVERADGAASTSDLTLGPTGGAESIDGDPIRRKAGIMATIEVGGEIRPGMAIVVTVPVEPHVALAPV